MGTDRSVNPAPRSWAPAGQVLGVGTGKGGQNSDAWAPGVPQQGPGSRGHGPQTCLSAPSARSPQRAAPACRSSCLGPCYKPGPRAMEGLQLGSLLEFNLDSERSRGRGGKWLSQGERRRGQPEPANPRHPRAFLELRQRPAREPDVTAPQGWAAAASRPHSRAEGQGLGCSLGIRSTRALRFTGLRKRRRGRHLHTHSGCRPHGGLLQREKAGPQFSTCLRRSFLGRWQRGWW